MSLMLVVLNCPGPLGRAMGMTLNVAVAYYHYSQNIMPPPCHSQWKLLCAVLVHVSQSRNQRMQNLIKCMPEQNQ